MGELHSKLVAELEGDPWCHSSQSIALYTKTEKGKGGGVGKQTQREAS